MSHQLSAKYSDTLGNVFDVKDRTPEAVSNFDVKGRTPEAVGNFDSKGRTPEAVSNSTLRSQKTGIIMIFIFTTDF